MCSKEFNFLPLAGYELQEHKIEKCETIFRSLQLIQARHINFQIIEKKSQTKQMEHGNCDLFYSFPIESHTSTLSLLFVLRRFKL